MSKKNRDQKIQFRKDFHNPNYDIDILNEMINRNGVPVGEFVTKDKDGFDEKLIDIEFYEWGSEEHIKVERKFRYGY